MINSILDRPLVVLDLETTSTDPNVARIVQIAVTKIFPKMDEEEPASQSVLINPGIHIPEEASKVHGIIDDDVKVAKKFSEVVDTFAEFLEGADLAGYNVKYDLRILDKEFERAGSPFRTTGSQGRTPYIIDAFRGWQTLEPRTLSDAYQKFCAKDATNAHDAMADVNMTLEVLKSQLPRFQNRELHSIEDIHKALWPGEVDRDGFFGIEKGETVFKFGKHKGQIALKQAGYLKWMLSSDFPEGTKEVIRGLMSV